MKAAIMKASDHGEYWAMEFSTLEELLLFAEGVGRIILEKNRDYHAAPFTNKTMWDKYKAQGVIDSEWRIIIYDDYVE